MGSIWSRLAAGGRAGRTIPEGFFVAKVGVLIALIATVPKLEVERNACKIP
jgi:hypothetical protein